MAPALPALYDDLTFHGPLSEARAGELVAFLAALETGCVVDVGCGWAELLLRVVASNPALTGIGIDLNDDDLARARAVAGGRGLHDRVRFVRGDASAEAPATAAGAICVGASQIWAGGDATDLDYAAALAALRAIVPRGGRVVYGEGIWSAPPTAAAMAALGGSPTEYATLPELVDTAVAHGFRPYGIGTATLDEWDAFESGYARRYEKWLAAHDATDPAHREVLDRADRHRRAWLHGYRGVLGMAYLQLVAC